MSKFLRVDLMCSYHQGKKLIVKDDRCVNYLLYLGDHSTMYIIQIISLHTLNIYVYICQLHLNKVGEKEENEKGKARKRKSWKQRRRTKENKVQKEGKMVFISHSSLKLGQHLPLKLLEQ